MLLVIRVKKSDIYVNKFICQNDIINQIDSVVILSSKSMCSYYEKRKVINRLKNKKILKDVLL